MAGRPRRNARRRSARKNAAKPTYEELMEMAQQYQVRLSPSSGPSTPKPKPKPSGGLWSASNIEVDSGGYSERGLRDYQEDRWFAKGNLVIVADGMGGHDAGDKAAELAVATITNDLPRSPRHDYAIPLAKLVAEANIAVYRFGEGYGRRRPGCTLTAGLMSDGALYVAHVGDSRCTLVYRGELTQVTKDHTQVQMMVDFGRISEEEARVHPLRNVITRSIGQEPSVEVDTVRVPVKVGQTFVFTSDGVHDYVPNDDFIRICEGSRNPDYVARRLVKVALANGSNDNATAVVMKMDPRPRRRARRKELTHGR